MERPPPNRAPRRAGSGRFPIKVSLSSNSPVVDPEPTPTMLGSSHRLPPPPPAPSRSQQRQESHQSAVAPLRRPAATPLSIGNERLRSNSEGLVQANRTKRMGIISRKASELGTVDEARTSRFSHYRGLSHGSVLKEHMNGVGSSAEGSTSPESPAESGRPRGQYVQRLSSLPELKDESRTPERTTEGVRGVLYSLALVHPHISSLIRAVRDGKNKRSSLERVFYNASTHIEEFDRELHSLGTYLEQNDVDPRRSSEAVRRACLTSVMAYQHVGGLLLRNARQLVDSGDTRYVRTLIWMVYGGLIEVQNACNNLYAGFDSERSAPTPQPERRARTRGRSITPTPERPNPASRLRAETVSKRGMVPGTGTYVPGLPWRSHNSSRAGSLTSNSTVMATPKSDESFALPSMPVDSHSRTNTMQGADESKDERQFEKIFLKLSHADAVVLSTVPHIKHQFAKCVEQCKKQETRAELTSLWNALDQRTSMLLRLAEQLKKRLGSIKLKEPGVENDMEFWQLCGAFVKAFVELALLVREAKGMELIPVDILQLLRPGSKVVKEAGLLIDHSPWRNIASYQPQQQPQPNSVPHHSQQAAPLTARQVPSTNGSSFGWSGQSPQQSSTANSSPYVSPIPATPLSAALGPAAQATVPTSSAPRTGMFSGNVFERAESLLSTPSRSLTSAMSYHGHHFNGVNALAARAHPKPPPA